MVRGMEHVLSHHVVFLELTDRVIKGHVIGLSISSLIRNSQLFYSPFVHCLFPEFSLFQYSNIPIFYFLCSHLLCFYCFFETLTATLLD